MTTYLDRIRARSRRINAKRARRLARAGRRAAAVESLASDEDQVGAIQNALGDHSLEPVPVADKLADDIDEAHRTLEDAHACVVCEGPHDRTKHQHPSERTTRPSTEPTEAERVRLSRAGVAPDEITEGMLEAMRADRQPAVDGTPAYTSPEQIDEAAAAAEQPVDEAASTRLDAPEVVARAEFTSSNVRTATLHADGALLVEFKDGGKYFYANVTPEMFEEWQAAKSAGSWFHHNVKNKPERHPATKAE